MGVPSLFTALQRRPRLLVAACTASVLLAVAAAQAAGLWWWRGRILKTAESRAANMAFVLSEYMRGSFAVADASLRQLAIHSTRVGGASAPADAWDKILESARASLPGSGSISVTDARGVVRRSTQKAIVGQSRRDNYVFTELARATRDELVVDRPFRSPLDPARFLIPIGRRLSAADGTFAGTIVAVVMPEVFRGFFRTVDVGDNGVVSVLHPDGFVLFREPSVRDPIGESASGHPVLEAARQGRASGTVHGPLHPGGSRYLSAYVASGGSPPLVVAVSLAESEVLASWRQQRRTSLLVFAAMACTLGLMVRGLFRQMNATSRAQQALGDVQRLEAQRLRDANDRLADALEREQRARRESDAANQLKDEFLMTVSHELRTPLTAIHGWARMLATTGLSDEQRVRALAAVERNARAQTHLVDDLLDVSRAISGKLRLEPRPANVAEVVRAAAETLGQALEAKSITFELEIEDGIGTVLLDPERLQQIVWNLLSNANKFTPQRGTVRLSLRRADASLEILVSDTGVGIEPDFLPYVFDRFRQADAGSRRRYGGLGLGLAIVRHLAELHGGTVTAESAGPGRGATFRVLLPVRVAAPGEKPAAFPTLSEA